MLHDRDLNNKINKIHKMALRIAYKDNVSSFENLLAMDNSATVHQKNLQLLTIENKTLSKSQLYKANF